jgi:hypothetical protein
VSDNTWSPRQVRFVKKLVALKIRRQTAEALAREFPDMLAWTVVVAQVKYLTNGPGSIVNAIRENAEALLKHQRELEQSSPYWLELVERDDG